MTTEHKKSQEQEEHIVSEQFGADISKHSWRNFLFFAVIFFTAFGFLMYRCFLPSASESPSGSNPTSITETTSKRKAADFLKKEMLGIADRLIEEIPGNERLRMLVVEAHLACLNYTQAKALLEEGISLNSRYGEFYRRMAGIARYHGEYDRAITFWQKTLEVSPEKSDLKVNIAEALMSLGKYREAIEELQKYIETPPESGLSYYLLGQGYLQLKEYDESKKYFEKAIAIQPDHPQANYGLATLYIRLKQPDKAREHMQFHTKWRQSRANSRKVYANSDLAGVVSDSLGEEFTLFSKYLAQLYLYGSGLYRAGQSLEDSEKLLRKGEKAFKRAIKIAPHQPDVYRDLSYMYVVTGRNLTEAVELAEKAVELKKSAGNYFALFHVCNRAFEAGKALKALEKAIELDPDNLQYKRTYDKITKGKK